jgi:hypothetical protein
MWDLWSNWAAQEDLIKKETMNNKDYVYSRAEEVDLFHKQIGFKIKNCIAPLMHALIERTKVAEALRSTQNQNSEQQNKYLEEYIRKINDKICELLALPTHSTQSERPFVHP